MWKGPKMRKGYDEKSDPQAAALRATLRDLRRVSSELNETNRALTERVQMLKEKT